MRVEQDVRLGHAGRVEPLGGPLDLPALVVEVRLVLVVPGVDLSEAGGVVLAGVHVEDAVAPSGPVPLWEWISKMKGISRNLDRRGLRRLRIRVRHDVLLAI